MNTECQYIVSLSAESVTITQHCRGEKTRMKMLSSRKQRKL